MRISDWSSDVCSSDLSRRLLRRQLATSATPNSVAAAIATDSIDTCIAAHPFANRGPSPRSPQGDKSLSREVPHMRSLLLLASAAALIALPAAAMQHDEIGRAHV